MDHESLLPWAFWFGERGWQAVLVDLRGHGRSTGRWLGFGPAESRELSRLLDRLGTEGRVRPPFMAFGVSYGASIGLRWAASDPRIDSVVAIAPYARLGEAVEGIRADFASWVPSWLIRSGVRALPRFLDVPAAHLDPIQLPPRPSIPTLFVAAENDTVARPEAVEELWRQWGPAARMLTVGDSAHEDLPFRFPEIAGALESWLEGTRKPTREVPSSP
jgi:pimeloyl-ACP methyl ester carboxylesterase